MVGYRVSPECRTLTERKIIHVETYWIVDEPQDKDYHLSIKGVPVRECAVPPYSQNPRHDFLDFRCPVNRWKVGVVYREKAALFPPEMNRTANVDLRIEMKVALDGKVIGEFKDTKLIKLQLPNRVYFNTEFDDIIYKSEPGKCWTAEQLAKVTGGEWIVPPPAGWYVQSFPIRGSLTLNTPRPALLMNDKIHSQESRAKILENISKFAGAMVTRAVEGLPKDFPLLKVRNISNAIWDIAIATRKRFQGKVIAVTGSSGKTTTCTMLKCLLKKDHNVKSVIQWNVYSDIPWFFATVNQNDAYVIIEMSANSLITGIGGSITNDITPNVAVVTSIAPAHTLKYGSLKDLAEGKSKILCGMSPGSYAVLNRDMPYYEIFEQKANALNLNVITFGTHPDAAIKMPVLTDGGEFFVMGKTYKLSCPVPAEQLYDALAVVGVSIAVGFPIEKTLDYLKTFTPVKGRGNVLKVNRGGKNLTLIDSTFNANPLSMKYALEHLKTFEPNQKSRVAILGDIGELGKEEIELHKGLASAMLDFAPDRLLLCGELMHYPYELIKDKLNVTWFKTLDELLKVVDSHLKDGDTILIKSSHSTGLSKVVALLNKIPPPHFVTSSALNVPKPLFDIKDFLPEEITPEQNGQIPADKLKRIHCGGYLYLDAARSWLAMIRAAAQDNVFLNLNYYSRAYRPIERQLTIFRQRFVPIENFDNLSANEIRVPFEDKVWRLKPKEAYAAIPGTSSHGYGLAVDIENSGLDYVKNWLSKNVEQFGFVREYDFEPWHYTYIKSREGIPSRVLEIENLPPEPTYSAEQIETLSGGKWFKKPPEGWTCNGIFYDRPLRAGYMAIVDQGDGVGIKESTISVIFRQLAGLICVNPAPLVKFDLPILAVADIKVAIKRLCELCPPIEID